MHNLLQVVWDAQPEIFTIFGFPIRWYGLMFAASFLLGFQIMKRIFKIENRPEQDLDALLMTMVISTVLGARMGHYIFYEGSDFLKDPIGFFLEMIVPPYSGLASHGAALGILVGLYIFVRRHKSYDYLWLTDRMVIVAALGGAFIRFGNFMNSEIVGTPSDVPWAVIFKQNTEFPMVPRHPAQLYESISCFVLFVILIILYNHWKTKTPRGSLTGLFFVWVFFLRFFYEFIKENQKDFESNYSLKMGQILSIPVVIFGIVILVRAFRKPETN